MSIGEKLEKIIKNTDLAYGSGYTAGQSKGYRQGYEKGGEEGHEAGLKHGIQMGMEDERRSFWNIYQKNGQRDNYQSAFLGFGFDFNNFYPMYDIRPQGIASAMFFGWGQVESQKGSLKKRLVDCGVELDTSQATNMAQAFYNTQFTELPTITLAGGTKTQMVLAKNPYLVTIDRVIVEENTEFNQCFWNDSALENVEFSGVIGQNGLDVSDSPQLSVQSLQSILDCLKDYSGSGITRTVTLGTENLAKLATKEIEAAQSKGWTLL